MKYIIIAIILLSSCKKDGICDLQSGILYEDDKAKAVYWSGNISLGGLTCEECEAKRDALRKMNSKYQVVDIRDGRIVPISDVIYCEKR